MSKLAKRQENGNKGEARTNAFLIDSFWVYRCNVDIAGADFWVREQAEDLEELFERQKRIEIFGRVQAKFFENRNEVEVLSEYVESQDGKPYAEFFISLHTDNAGGSCVDYFFVAAEIQREFRRRQNAGGKQVYVFSVTDDRQFEAFKNIPSTEKNRRILTGMKETSQQRNAEFIGTFFSFARAHGSAPQSRNRWCQPVRVAESEWRLEAEGTTYSWSKKGAVVSLQKTNHSTGVTSVGSSLSLDDPDRIEFDTITETSRARS